MAHERVLDALLERYGRTFADEAGIPLADKPSPLFQLLVLTSLLSANLDAHLGLRAMRTLGGAGLRTPRRLLDAGHEGRWQVLSDARYLRKEQTARQLGQLAEEVLDHHRGDLRRLRDETSTAGELEEALQGFTGIGAVGAAIFCREVQAVWPSLRPYADDKVEQSAERLGLPHSRKGLAGLANSDDLSLLGAALVRCDLAGDAEELRRG
ncbi:endonuclease [Nocardioides marmoraquaticus]